MGSPLPGHAEFVDLGSAIGLKDGDLTFAPECEQNVFG
jgi:hypothetical protein